MTNANPTIGKWIVEKQNNPIRQQVVFASGLHVCVLPDGDKDGFHDSANASLIAEAGNVYSETGLTPRQLQQQRDELLSALTTLKTAVGDETFIGCETVGKTLRSRLCDYELNGAILKAKSAIAAAKGGAS